MQQRQFNRRDFIITSLSAAAALPIIGCAGDSSEDAMNSETKSHQAPAIGLPGVQLYTVRSLMEVDVGSTLDAVADIGYKEVEFAGYFGLSALEIFSLLERRGLKAPAAHISMETLRTKMGKVIEDARAIGHRYVVVPSIPDEERQSLDNYRRVADELNEWGARMKDSAIGLAYHNHEFEFEEIDGEVPYNLLLELCDPELVSMELDLFWIRDAGFDPIPYFEGYPGRFKLCHVKDMTSDGEMTDVGSGVIDFATLFGYAELAGLEHFFVEHDEPADPIESIRNSYGTLSDLL